MFSPKCCLVGYLWCAIVIMHCLHQGCRHGLAWVDRGPPTGESGPDRTTHSDWCSLIIVGDLDHHIFLKCDFESEHLKNYRETNLKNIGKHRIFPTGCLNFTGWAVWELSGKMWVYPLLQAPLHRADGKTAVTHSMMLKDKQSINSDILRIQKHNN
jgi:hypothetical protein